MNIPALGSPLSSPAAFLAANGASPSAPSAAQLEADRNALAASAKGGTPSASEIRKAASQFEAIILRQLLAPSIEPVMSGGLGGGGSSGGGIYGYMLTDVLATSLSQGGGMGLASMLEKQLSPPASGADITSSNRLPISKPRSS